jgi:solute carrier family 35 (UDP-xylose/UDP-N-acetylglucosamine transporter), member B4
VRWQTKIAGKMEEETFPPMLKRRRSASLPRDLGDGFFIGESDFHSDVYDDTNDELPELHETATVPQELPETNSLDIQSKLFSVSMMAKIFLMILTGAFSSILYEMVLKIDNGSSLFAAFILHVWIVLISLPNAFHYLFQPKIPMYFHLLVVGLSFSFLFLKSFAIQLLPMPIIIVCSNMQLVLGLVVGKLLFQKIFCLFQYLSVLAITVGVILITLSSTSSSTQSSSSSSSSVETLQGVCYILLAILSIAIMIPVGSMIVQKYNADIEEQIFFQHFFSLPLFFLQWHRIQPVIDRLYSSSAAAAAAVDMSLSASASSASSSVLVLWKIPIPLIFFFLIGTTILGQINRYLTMEISLSLNPLLSQLLNAINKTIVLLVSMIYFNSPPYPSLIVWLGVVIQTVGSIGYVQASFSETSSGNFKPNKRLSRFSRTSLSLSKKGSAISEMDLNHLRLIAAKKERERLIQEGNANLKLNSSNERDGEREEKAKTPDGGMRRRVAYSSLSEIKHTQ